jgi:hypothetical protein
MRHGKNSFLQESGEELAPGHELHDEVELLLRLEGVGQAHEEGVPQVGHDESFWGQCYKTFYGCNLRASVFVPGQPILMFTRKAGAYPSEVIFKCSTVR